MAAEKTNMPTDRVKASTPPPSTAPSDGDSTNFIRAIVEEDIKTGKWGGRLMTRFPPEPNGYLHLGHAKSICLNFGLARDYNGSCHLRFDDTDPSKESIEYVDSIKADVRWLGFEWEDREYYASDYFEQLFEYAVELIKKGKAYIDSLPPDQIRQYRGTLTQPGLNSPYRERSVEENLDLFQRMKAGEFEDGAHVLRAKIDMAAPNLLMRDPALFRIKHVSHYRTGNQWCIYPMYDFTHCLSDSIEGITHSLCTLEFEINRELYDWILDQLEVYHPQQIEFARLNLTYTVLSKRKLIELVTSHRVDGWDDPRMPTLSGIRRRGYSPAAIRNFCDRIGVAKSNSTVDIALLEYCVREDLNKTAPRVMAVLNPLKLVIDNYPDDSVEMLEAENNPEDPAGGSRQIPFSKILYVERDDFRESAPRKWFRLAPGKEVRLKHAYYITCNEVVTDPQTGEITELHCTYDPATKGGWSEDGRKVKGTLHWVSASHALPADVYLYDRLFVSEDPEEFEDGRDFKANLNPDSLTVLRGCRVEPSLADAESGQRFQFLRLGYFCVDYRHTRPDRLVFNRTVTLRDSWAKIEKTLK